MAVSNFNIPLGAEEQFYATAETTFGTFVKPSGSDAIVIKTSSFGIAHERVPRADKHSSRSVLEQIERKRSVEFTVTEYWNPSGVAGTEQDDSSLIEAVCGTKAVAGTVTYSLAKDISKSFSLHRISGEYSQSITGAVVNQMVIRVKGEEAVEVEFSGFGKDFIHTHRATLAASAASGATTITVDSADVYYFRVN